LIGGGLPVTVREALKPVLITNAEYSRIQRLGLTCGRLRRHWSPSRDLLDFVESLEGAAEKCRPLSPLMAWPGFAAAIRFCFLVLI
jgi:hypothetical protein